MRSAYSSEMATTEGAAGQRARLRNSTSVFLVGDLDGTAQWYERLGFEARVFPPGFATLRRDSVEIFLQHTDGYVRPDDHARDERDAWDVYIGTDNVAALFAEFSRRPGVNILREPSPQEYGQIEFDVMDPNGYRLVFAQRVR
jgi:hypothetical protein